MKPVVKWFLLKLFSIKWEQRSRVTSIPLFQTLGFIRIHYKACRALLNQVTSWLLLCQRVPKIWLTVVPLFSLPPLQIRNSSTNNKHLTFSNSRFSFQPAKGQELPTVSSSSNPEWQNRHHVNTRLTEFRSFPSRTMRARPLSIYPLLRTSLLKQISHKSVYSL